MWFGGSCYKTQQSVLWIGPVLFLLGTASCAQTLLTDVWKDKEYRGIAAKIAVFCIAQDRARTAGQNGG